MPVLWTVFWVVLLAMTRNVMDDACSECPGPELLLCHAVGMALCLVLVALTAMTIVRAC